MIGFTLTGVHEFTIKNNPKFPKWGSLCAAIWQDAVFYFRSVISLFILQFVSFDEGFRASFPASPQKDRLQRLAALSQIIAGPFTEMNNRFLSAETFILSVPRGTDPSCFHWWQPWADSHLSLFGEF